MTPVASPTKKDSLVVTPPGAVDNGSEGRIAWTCSMAQKLSTQLRNYGCDLAPVEFKRVLATAKRELFPGMTDEYLVCTDEESAVYCEEVRRRVGRDLPRPFIRFQLLNVRKSQAIV